MLLTYVEDFSLVLWVHYTLKGKTPLGQPSSKEVVDFGKVIGYHVDPVTGVKTPTTKGTNGVHVVPARG